MLRNEVAWNQVLSFSPVLSCFVLYIQHSSSSICIAAGVLDGACRQFSSVIEYAKSLNLKEADKWTIVAGVARIQTPIDVEAVMGVDGSSDAVYYDAGSLQCNLPEPA